MGPMVARHRGGRNPDMGLRGDVTWKSYIAGAVVHVDELTIKFMRCCSSCLLVIDTTIEHQKKKW